MSKVAPNARPECFVCREGDFSAYVLRSRSVEVAVVPELGGRIVRIGNIKTGREWLWHPSDKLNLFRNNLGDDFSRSPLAGLDECLPTIEPCRWRGRQIPDHGEVWSVAWSVDHAAWRSGVLRAMTTLPVSPFDFERTVELHENEIRLSYWLRSRSEVEEYFLWAMHPLLAVQPGDHLVLPASTRSLLNGEIWVDALDAALPDGTCSKRFARPVREGATAIYNSKTGDRLEFEWSARENDTLGLWLTRGGWHGHHHLAVEPANADLDSLSVAAAQKRCGKVGPRESVSWQVCMRVHPR